VHFVAIRMGRIRHQDTKTLRQIKEEKDYETFDTFFIIIDHSANDPTGVISRRYGFPGDR
jgi:hypothetical protein